MTEPGGVDNPKPQVNLEEKRAPKYEQRKSQYQSERDKKRTTRKPEVWPASGFYGHRLSPKEQESITINGIELREMERVMYEQIMAVLAAKREDNVQTPVVVLDFGGMYGISTIKLAKATEELAKQGKVVYVVSNLTFNPGEMSEGEVKGPGGLGRPRHNDFFLQNRDLVNFIIADADELKDTQIPLFSGENLPLFGNIDIIHEKATLYNSELLDSDLPTLGKALSPYGILFLGTKRNVTGQWPNPFDIGIKNLTRGGTSELNLGDESDYRVFVEPKTPRPQIE